MKRKRIAVLFFLVSLTVVSCSKLSNGDPETEQRSLGAPFDIICMYNNVNVHLVESRHPHLELTCPKNLIDNIVTEVRNDSLIIRNDNDFNWLRRYDYSIDLTVYYDSLREINFASIGTLTTQDSLRGRYTVDNDSLGGGGRYAFMLRTKEGCGDIDLTFNCDVLRDRFFNGTSCIVLRGVVGYAEHIVRSYGTVHAEEMNANIVTIQHESTNDLYVWVRDGGSLQAQLNSIGNLYYKGHPRPSDTHIKCKSDGRAYPIE